MAGMSNAVENKVLDHLFGDGTYTVTAPLYLAFTTVAVTDTDTGSTITEATYTGYARTAVGAADMSAASGGSKTNSNTITGPACTAGTSTLAGWALLTTSSGAGDIVFYGTLPNQVVSTTNTPPTVPPGALVCSLD